MLLFCDCWIQTPFFFCSTKCFLSPILFCLFSPDPLLGSLLILHHQPQRCIYWAKGACHGFSFYRKVTVSLGTFKSPFLAFFRVYSNYLPGAPPSIFSVFLSMLSWSKSSLQAPLHIWADMPPPGLASDHSRELGRDARPGAGTDSPPSSCKLYQESGSLQGSEWGSQTLLSGPGSTQSRLWK